MFDVGDVVRFKSNSDIGIITKKIPVCKDLGILWYVYKIMWLKSQNNDNFIEHVYVENVLEKVEKE